ncbi:MAG TPA: T9SS type A sorting domain-containing protein [Ignavibacteria bacterium]|nr:T9SS type A sorting domain-containing protein [Ignavibacteria bacterium]HMR39488.1 T9SS type A sorting domain-containing protein [Ignavibacteria bacterium]
MRKIFTFTGTILLYSVLIFSFSVSNCLFAQDNVGGQPMSFLLNLNSDINTVTMPEVDAQRLLEEDAATAGIPDIPLRYAKVLDTDLNLNNSGTWTNLPDGSRIWRLEIRSEDAKSLNLNYKNFYMPKGATFFVYNLNRSMVLGGFTEKNNSKDGQFATATTTGFVTIAEYYEPVYSKGKGSLSVSQVIHAYKDIMGFSTFLELPCNININCPIGAPWVNQKRSVAKMTFQQGGSGFLCTGSLINNTLQNRTPYFLTAQHCESDNWSTLVLNFNYESVTCSSLQPGSFQSVSGATSIAENFDTDVRLLLLNDQVPASTNSYFNGWDRSGSIPQNETAIHHPGGAIKKISVDNNPASNSNGFGGRLPSGFWQVVWDEGMTEGGSSGCPLYDQNGRVVGQNLGGIAGQCENPQIVTKVFGKFSESWAHGGSSTNQLKNWLDPDNSNVITLDGMDDITGVAPVANFTSNTQNLPIGGGSVNYFDLSTNNPESWSWSFPGGTPSTSTDQNPTGISYTATGAYTVTLTTTNSFGSNMMTVVNYVKVAGVPLTAFSLQSPGTNTTIMVSQNDPTLVNFIWGSSTPGSTVNYLFKIKKAGPFSETVLQSNNNGSDTMISLRKSYLDSLALSFGLTGDSVNCSWRASALNGLDTLNSTPFIVKIRRTPVGINQISSYIPDKFNLYNNYPNPFNPGTVIRFDISNSQFVKLSVYNMLGEEVTNLVNENLSPGSYSVDFNASDLSSGMYFYRIETPGFVQTKRMVLVK